MSTNYNPQLWGSAGWKFLFFIAFAYPKYPTEQDKQRMFNFFMLIKELLPCESCRMHFSNHLNKFPLNTEALLTTENLVRWLNNVHNEVNISLGQPKQTIEDIQNKYILNNKKNNIIIDFFKKRTVIVSLMILLIILLVGTLVYTNKQ